MKNILVSSSQDVIHDSGVRRSVNRCKYNRPDDKDNNSNSDNDSFNNNIATNSFFSAAATNTNSQTG